MITMKDLVHGHREIAAITATECHVLAAILEALAGSWLMRRFLPKTLRDRSLQFRMLAATLAKAPAGSGGSLESEIRTLIRKDQGKRVLLPRRQEFSAAELEGAGRDVRKEAGGV